MENSNKIAAAEKNMNAIGSDCNDYYYETGIVPNWLNTKYTTAEKAFNDLLHCNECNKKLTAEVELDRAKTKSLAGYNILICEGCKEKDRLIYAGLISS